MSLPPRAQELGMVGCHVCRLVVEDTTLDPGSPAACPRCGATLHRRRPDSIAQAWAFLVAAMVFYIPANLLPVMQTTSVGHSHESTIIGGVMEFWEARSFGIALLIFVASIVVPCLKFVVMGLLLATSQRRSTWATQERATLFRLVEWVGYWSMLDVLVVAVVAALVKFQSLADVEPRVGILFFGTVVVLTMIAALRFDPRLIWDTDNHA